jgi:hypothetical protein
MSKRDDKVVDLAPVRDVLANAQRINAAEFEAAPAADDYFPADEFPTGGGRDEPPAPPRPRDDGLPDDCPIKALGRDADGRTFFYANELNLLTVLNASEHTHNYFMAMCGTQVGYLYQQWPQKKLVKSKDDNGDEVEEWIVTGFNSAQVRDSLMMAASVKGVWSPTDKLRGRGAWRDEAGGLLLHCGSALVRSVNGRLVSEEPGEVEGYVYSAAPKIPFPATDPVPQDGLAQELYDVLKTWNWTRTLIDRDMMFGWIGAAMIGGALDVRPICWLTGDKATGKTTLHKLLKLLFGDAMLATGDTSSAGLYQRVGPASLAIAVDELEADADNKRAMDLIKLARNAFSGAVMFRGGADHKGVSFQARSAFLFSSILIPPLGSQDRSRMAILDLKPLVAGTKALNLDPKKWREVGRAILRRLIDNWGRFASTLDAYSGALTAKGHDMRGALQLGTLLTCRDLILFDHPVDSDTLAELAARFAPDNLAEISDTEADHVQCLNHLAQAQPDHWRGGSKYSTAELCRQFMSFEEKGNNNDAQAALASGGMRIVEKVWKKDGDPWPRRGGRHYLAVANTHEGTRFLFKDSRWEGVSGLPGVWTQSLGRVPGAEQGNERIAGRMTRCRLIPMDLVITDEDSFARDQRAADLNPLEEVGGDQPPPAQSSPHTDD